MSRDLSVQIVIGAVLGSSVASAFGSAARHVQTLSGRIAEASKKSAVLGRALDLAAKKADIEKRMAAGEAGLERELARVTAQYNRAAQAASQYGKSVADWERAQRSANAELQRLSRIQIARNAFSANNQKIMGGIGGGIALGAGLGAMASTGAAFDKQMARVGAVARASAQDLAALRDQAKEMGRTTQWSAVQAAEGMQFLAMAGFKTREIMQTMPGMLSLASAASIDLGRAADIASNILTGFGLEASEMGRVGDILTNAFTSSNTSLEMLGQSMKYVGPAAKAFGLSLEETTALVAKLGDAGIQADQAGTALRQMMVRMAKPTKQVSTAMAQIGLQVKNADGSMKSMTQIMSEMAAATDKLTQADKLRVSAAIFGTEALSAGMVLMKEAAKGTLPEYTQALTRAGAAEEVARKQNDNLSGDVTILKSAWEGLAITIFERLEPALRALTKKATDVISAVTGWMEKHKTLSTVLLAGAAAIGTVSAAILPAIAVWKTFSMAIALVKAPLLAFNLLMSANPIGLVVAGVALLAAGLVALVTHWDTVSAKISECWNAFTAWASGIGAKIGEVWNSLSTFAAQVGSEFVQGLCQAWDNIKAGFAAAFSGLVEIAKVPLNFIIGAINKVISGINSIGSIKLPSALGGPIGINIPTIPQLATGGIATSPTLALVGEGRESEAVLPLSKLENLIGARGGTGEINVNFAPVINVSGGGSAPDQLRQGLTAGMHDLKRELARLMQEQRRLSFA